MRGGGTTVGAKHTRSGGIGPSGGTRIGVMRGGAMRSGGTDRSGETDLDLPQTGVERSAASTTQLCTKNLSGLLLWPCAFNDSKRVWNNSRIQQFEFEGHATLSLGTWGHAG